ncbi:MAG: sodium:solute symporter family protein [Bacteroidota bacterium]
MVTLSPADIIVLVLYFVVVLAIGFLSSRRRIPQVDYLLAGRSLTTPMFVMTLVSTWYGGILGVGEFSYRYGISNWTVQGVPYYVFAIVFAFLLAKRIRRTNFTTIPDKLEEAYGRPTALAGAGLTFFLVTPAPYVLMIGVLLQMVTGWSLAVCVLTGTVATVIYLFTGGFRADVNTDVFEFGVMFLGFGVILPFAAAKFGGWRFIVNNVPSNHLTWDGGNSLQFVIVWFFIALWTLVDPSFHQRCYAAKSGEVAQRGILISVIFWIVFDAMTATAGLYARAALPHLDQPVLAYPMLAEATLPPIAKGLFYAGMLATIMSTLNTLAFVSATTLGRDLVARAQGSIESPRAIAFVRWGLLVMAVVSVALALLIPSVIRLWYTIGTVIVPGLLIPLVTAYFERWKAGPGFTLASMTAGWVVSLGWLIAGWSQQMGDASHYPLGIEPMYPGLVVSLMIWAVGIARTN